VNVAVDAAAEADFGRGFDEDREVVERAQGGVVERQDSFNDDVGFDWDREGAVGDAGVGGEVVHRRVDVGASGQRLDVLGEEGSFEGVGVVEVLLVALVKREVGEVAVVQIERQQCGGELLGQLAGKRRLARAGAARNRKDEWSWRSHTDQTNCSERRKQNPNRLPRFPQKTCLEPALNASKCPFLPF